VGFLERPENRFLTLQKGSVNSISTEVFNSSEGGFPDQITSDRAQTNIR